LHYRAQDSAAAWLHRQHGRTDRHFIAAMSYTPTLTRWKVVQESCIEMKAHECIATQSCMQWLGYSPPRGSQDLSRAGSRLKVRGHVATHLQMVVTGTAAESIIVGAWVHGGLLEPGWGGPLPCVQLDLMAGDVMTVAVCAVEGVGTGTRREVPWQGLYTCTDS